jgi:hypothetical protein
MTHEKIEKQDSRALEPQLITDPKKRAEAEARNVLRQLDRHPSNLGKETVTHARGCHDDRANCLVGCIRVLNNHLGFNSEYPFGNAPDRDDPNNKQQKEDAAANEAPVLNHAPGGTINPRRPVAADATAPILLPLSGAQRTWPNLPPVRGSRERPKADIDPTR